MSENDAGEEGHSDSDLSFPQPYGVLRALSDTDSDDDDSNDGGSIRQFDTNIPTLHKYLGRLNTISGYSFFDDGEILTLLAIHTNTIVSPGFTLPLILDIASEEQIVKQCIAEKSVFAVVFEDKRGHPLFPYGVIMEVYESFSKRGSMYFKARGRQRCKLMLNSEVRYLGGRLLQVTIKALAEPDIKSPISCTQLLKLKANRPYCYDSDKLSRYRPYHLAQFPYASWVYDHNEVLYYCKVVREMLEKHHVKDYIPTDPVSLSFWFLQNFLLLHEERLAIMKINTVLERLKLEHKCLLLERIICCRVCREKLAEHKDVFAMSRDGAQSTYCNPGGHVYETITVKQCRNYTLAGSPSREFSWFPGYQWTILHCKTCRDHIGWQFTSKTLHPPVFFGLARASLNIKILSSTDEMSDV